MSLVGTDMILFVQRMQLSNNDSPDIFYYEN
jgi:hypothetical protein